MPVPAMLAAAAPWVLSTLGAMVPQIIDAFRGSKSPEDVQKLVQPRYDELVQRMVGGGMPEEQAHKMAQELITPEMEKAAEGEPMNPFLAMGLSTLGAVGGWKGGVMAGKGLKNMGRSSALAKRRVDPARLSKLKTASSTTPKAAASKVADLDDAAVAPPVVASPFPKGEAQRPPDAWVTREQIDDKPNFVLPGETPRLEYHEPADSRTGRMSDRPRGGWGRKPPEAFNKRDDARMPIDTPSTNTRDFVLHPDRGTPRLTYGEVNSPFPGSKPQSNPREAETDIMEAITEHPPGRQTFAGKGDLAAAVARKARDPHQEDLDVLQDAMDSLMRVPGDE